MARESRADREARRERNERYARFLFSGLKLIVVEQAGRFGVEAEPFAGLQSGDVQCILQCTILDSVFWARDAPDGAVLYHRSVFASRAGAERSARIWREKFGRMDGPAVVERAEASDG